MPHCDICTKAFGVEVCVNLDPPFDSPEAHSIKALKEEGGLTGRYGMIEAAFFYCYTCWKAAHETATATLDTYPTVDDTKRIARQMVVHRVRST